MFSTATEIRRAVYGCPSVSDYSELRTARFEAPVSAVATYRSEYDSALAFLRDNFEAAVSGLCCLTDALAAIVSEDVSLSVRQARSCLVAAGQE
jgi:hypothetical protein